LSGSAGVGGARRVAPRSVLAGAVVGAEHQAIGETRQFEQPADLGAGIDQTQLPSGLLGALLGANEHTQSRRVDELEASGIHNESLGTGRERALERSLENRCSRQIQLSAEGEYVLGSVAADFNLEVILHAKRLQGCGFHGTV
jgi:hypothetical protein